MSVGIGTTEGDLIQLKKWWDETLEGIGYSVLKAGKFIAEGFKMQLLFFSNAGIAAETYRVKTEGMINKMLQAHQKFMDIKQAQIDANKEDLKHNRYLEELAEREEKRTTAVKTGTTALQDYIKYMKAASDGKIYGPSPPTASEIITGKSLNSADAVTKLNNAPVGYLPTGGLNMGGMSQPANNTLSIMQQLSSVLDGIGGRLGGLYGGFSSVFSSITQVVTASADKSKERWKGMADGILSAIQGVMNMITSIIAQGYEQRMQAVDTYYSNEKEKIQNSTLPEQEKRKRIEKMDKEQEKKRKELMRQQAKDQKAVSIIQAIIAGALSVVSALSVAPPAGIILAAVVGALAATQIAMIASQPLPALASGGLVYGPTTALIGEYANAAINPEVITPLDKLKGMLSDTFGGVLTARVTGDDLLFVVERAGSKRTRTRGY